MGIDVTDEIRKDVNEMCNYGDYLYSKGEMKGEMEAYFLLVQDGDISLDRAAEKKVWIKRNLLVKWRRQAIRFL